MGEIVSDSYVWLPCFILGVGALFGGIIIQRLVLDFNIFFCLQGILKLAPIICVICGFSIGFIYIWYYINIVDQFSGEKEFVKDIIRKI